MRVKDIVIGETYYKKDTRYYAKVLKVLPPNTDENYNYYTVCKVEYSPQPLDKVAWGFIKYFKPSDLEKIE